MNPIESASDVVADPVAEGWIPLSAMHLFPWLLLLIELLRGLILGLLRYGFRGAMFVFWGFLLVQAGLGLAALGIAFQEQGQKTLGSLRRAAFGLAAVALILRIGLALIPQFGARAGMNFFHFWMLIHSCLTLMALAALILLVIGHDQDSGGRFDAAVLCMLIAGGLGWLCFPVLAIAAMNGHPLLAASWQVIRQPGIAQEGGWFDALDESLRLRNLGAWALSGAVMFMVLLGQTLFTFGRWGNFGRPLWWNFADVSGLMFGSLALAIHVLKGSNRIEGRKGRGLAIAAMITNGVPLLLLIIGVAVLLVLIKGNHF